MAQSRLVLAVDPTQRAVTAHLSRENIRILTRDDTVDAADVVPGFAPPVPDLFDQAPCHRTVRPSPVADPPLVGGHRARRLLFRSEAGTETASYGEEF